MAPGEKRIGPTNPRRKEKTPDIRAIRKILEIARPEKWTSTIQMTEQITSAINKDTTNVIRRLNADGKNMGKKISKKMKNISGKKMRDLIKALFLLIAVALIEFNIRCNVRC